MSYLKRVKRPWHDIAYLCRKCPSFIAVNDNINIMPVKQYSKVLVTNFCLFSAKVNTDCHPRQIERTLIVIQLRRVKARHCQRFIGMEQMLCSGLGTRQSRDQCGSTFSFSHPPSQSIGSNLDQLANLLCAQSTQPPIPAGRDISESETTTA